MLYTIVEFIKENKKICLIVLAVAIIVIVLIVNFAKGSKKEEGPVVGPPPIVHSELDENGEFSSDEFKELNEEAEVEEEYLIQGVIY